MQIDKYFRVFEPKWSGKRDLNPRPLPWQGNALPTELFPHKNMFKVIISMSFMQTWILRGNY